MPFRFGSTSDSVSAHSEDGQDTSSCQPRSSRWLRSFGFRLFQQFGKGDAKCSRDLDQAPQRGAPFAFFNAGYSDLIQPGQGTELVHGHALGFPCLPKAAGDSCDDLVGLGIVHASLLALTGSGFILTIGRTIVDRSEIPVATRSAAMFKNQNPVPGRADVSKTQAYAQVDRFMACRQPTLSRIL